MLCYSLHANRCGVNVARLHGHFAAFRIAWQFWAAL
jgi:hypothetical protein